MALLKCVTTIYGVDAQYHKVTQTNINWHSRQAEVVVQSFLSKEARLNGAYPLTSAGFLFHTDDFPFTFEGNTVEEAYLAIKQKPQFADAVDDL